MEDLIIKLRKSGLAVDLKTTLYRADLYQLSDELEEISYDFESDEFAEIVNKYLTEKQADLLNKYIEQFMDNDFYYEATKEEFISSVNEPPRSSKIIYYVIWILSIIVAIISVLFAVGFIFALIYAIRAEFREPKPRKISRWRILKRSIQGFSYVAQYWNKYGIW